MSRHSMSVALGLAFAAYGLPSVARGVEFQICDFEITNGSAAVRSELHLEFTNTGGTAVLTLLKNAPGCPLTAPIITNPGTPWDITWTASCIDPGETVIVRIQSEKPLVVFSSGNWNDGAATVDAGDVVRIRCVPTVSQWGLFALTLVLLTAGAIVLRRRSVSAH